MRISARNVLKGHIKEIKHGVVNAEVIIALPSGTEIVAMITETSVATLNLTVGKEAYAVIKASNVMVAVD